jgi:hypothetical protein
VLKIYFGNRPEFVKAMQTKAPRIMEVLTGKVTRLMFMLSSYVVSRKLSGQILHRRTGILSASIRAIPATVAGTKIIGEVQAGSGPAFYGAVHEYGGSRAYPILAVKGRALAFMMNGKQIFAKSVIHPPAKMRAFFTPSLDENAENIKAELQKAVDGVIKE